MKICKTKVSNFEGAFRGLRNPLESWHKSDSKFGIATTDVSFDWEVATEYAEKEGLSLADGDYFNRVENKYASWLRENGIINSKDNVIEYAYIGPNDLDLAHRMIKAGSSDSKFLRQIQVSVDITAPLYWY